MNTNQREEGPTERTEMIRHLNETRGYSVKFLETKTTAELAAKIDRMAFCETVRWSYSHATCEEEAAR